MIHISESWLIGFLSGLFFAASVGVLVLFYMARTR